MSNQPTIVTGLWDIGRDQLKKDWSRSFDHYLDRFAELLVIDLPMIIFGEESLREFVSQRRSPENTLFVARPLTWFENEHFADIQRIRQLPEWRAQAGWLGDSTQAQMPYYNPLVMSKPFLLNDARLLDPFSSTHLYWLDAGITHTVSPGYFTEDRCLKKIARFDSLSFVAFPYAAEREIHGFSYPALCELAGDRVNKVCRGGLFGGPVEDIEEFNKRYYALLKHTLEEGLMGTEESLFTILLYQYPGEYEYYAIEDNGLLLTFFEDLKHDRQVARTQVQGQVSVPVSNTDNTALYILTFNSPDQLATLLKSMREYDADFLKRPDLILIDNSTDLSTTAVYQEICEKNNLLHLKQDNLGICGGRQFAAEHADAAGYDFYFFFEDDMFFYPQAGTTCRNGFSRYTKGLYRKCLKISKRQGFDFLKLSFTEFYGDNSTQWAWYNLPADFRRQRWPDNHALPERRLASRAPRTSLGSIYRYDGLAYADGEIYYCNWPQLISRAGNRKMFLDTKWDNPYEQTWMSHFFQQTLAGDLYPGVLLLSPTEHDRFDHYDAALRRES